MDKSTDVINAITKLSHFYKHESCGQCTPCREGTGWMWRMMERLVTGNAEIEEIDVIIDLLGEQVEEHKDYVDERENIFDLVTTWPPMLLPAPFKRRGPDDSEIDMDEEYQT